MTLYRMSDDPAAESRAAIPCTAAEARRFNTPELGFGIFATVNSFDGPRRKENLRRIDAWAIDMDEGSKNDQRLRIHKSPLVPSLVVETKRGYQVYWCAKDGRAEHWNAIVLERLVPAFGADPNARDVCRILRVPGFLHLKDPANPFQIRAVWKHHVSYTERQMGAAFRWVPDRRAVEESEAAEKRAAAIAERERQRQEAAASGIEVTTTFWEAVYQLDARETLTLLSGSHWVGGESYTFKPAPRSRWNIWVDGKSTSCFIDEVGHIGSSQHGGPTPAQWLRWFRHGWPQVVEALCSVHPHLADIRAAERAAWIDQQRKARAA